MTKLRMYAEPLTIGSDTVGCNRKLSTKDVDARCQKVRHVVNDELIKDEQKQVHNLVSDMSHL